MWSQMFELVLSKAFVLLAHLAMFNLVAVPVLMVLVISLLCFSVLMFNLCMLEKNFSFVTQALVTAVEELLNVDMSVLALNEDEKHTDKCLLHHFWLCSNSAEFPL